jgi:dipeptidyl aminopeptidase/acylaminoacyl peptidase
MYMQTPGTLVAQRMELRPPRLVSEPTVVAEGVRGARCIGSAEFSLSRQGTLFYIQGTGEGRYRFGWLDRSGKLLETIGEPVQGFGSFMLSPEGTRVAYQVGPDTPRSDVWVMDLARSLSTRISFNKGTAPHWSPDGKFVYYNNASGIYRKAADGSGEEMLLTKARRITDYVGTVSPDGTILLFGATDIMKLPLAAGGGNATPLSLSDGTLPQFSPDGRWLAYSSNESGRQEIYIQGYPDKRGKWRVSAKGGTYSVWRANGKELYWIGLDGMLMAADVELQANEVRLSRPQELFRFPVVNSFPVFQPDRDGQRFLVYEPESAISQKPSMVVVQNWAAKLRKVVR